MDRFINRLYDYWIDEVNNIPLTNRRNTEINSALYINQQLITNIHQIRRHLELDDLLNTMPITTITSPIATNSIVTRTITTPSITAPSITTPISLITRQNTIPESQNQTYFLDVFQEFMDRILDQNISEETTILEDVKITLSEEDFNKLKTEEVTENNQEFYKNELCNICMDPYVIGQKLTLLPCKHEFHTDCIHHWLCNEKVTCPMCRKDTRDT
jgi:hypothetical protein